MHPETLESFIRREEQILEVLAPFGFFKWGEKGSCQFAHRDVIGPVWDLSASDPIHIIKLVYYRGQDEGVKLAQRSMRTALGI